MRSPHPPVVRADGARVYVAPHGLRAREACGLVGARIDWLLGPSTPIAMVRFGRN